MAAVSKPGPKNLITDISGLTVGNSSDANIKTGTTVLVGDAPFTASVLVMGGAPGTKETDLLAPDKTMEDVDGFVLSGGSAFGLDACSGVMDGLRDAGRGFPVGVRRVPIVPGAIIFDLINGGDKNWTENPYRALGLEAFNNRSKDFDLGTVGAVYPFQGWELVMTVLGVLFWLGWHRMQFIAESKELEDAVNSYKGPEATQAIERY